MKTPHTSLATQSIQTAQPGPTTTQPAEATQASPVAQFVASLRPELKQVLSDTLNIYRNANRIPTTTNTSRITRGPNDSPLHFIEWVDIKCPHCRNLHDALQEISGITAPGSWHLETRNYPLDSECNPKIQKSDGSGVRCTAAKMLICLADHPQTNAIRSEFFAAQETLTVEQLWNITASHEVDAIGLAECIGSEKTAGILANDISAAEQHGITGTPLLVLNGKQAPALPALIYAMILANGNVDDPAFASLPAPRMQPQ